LEVTVTGRSALVRVEASSQQITAHARLVLVRELADRLRLSELLDAITVKKRAARGSSPAQAMLALCETLIAGEYLDDVAGLRGAWHPLLCFVAETGE